MKFEGSVLNAAENPNVTAKSLTPNRVIPYHGNKQPCSLPT